METLVIISGNGCVLLMSRLWDVIQEVSLFQEDFGSGDHFLNFQSHLRF